MKFYHIALLIVIGLFANAKVIAGSGSLSYCEAKTCETVLHNKKLNKATLIVWTGESNIIHSYTFELDKSAKLQSKIANLNSNNNEYATQSDSGAPPAPCQSGSCSLPVSRTYETTTETITVTTTYIYRDGELIDVMTSESRKPKPNIPVKEK
ncbi:hypothetical protein [Kangiella sp. TOML190]|uniref:hypothetical protein n=1 Tax=Kangiella sp. TOML190 TaxID=2931351 RepID=UPI00203A55A4|nr:hypothetical protein [Kangiella sp. TOML190]